MIIILTLLIINELITANPIINYPNEIDSNEINIIKQKLKNYNETTKKVISEFNINSVDNTKISNAIKMLFPTTTIVHNETKNSLIIKHSKEDYNKIKKLIKSINIKTKQFFFECKIYELSINSQKEFDLFNDVLQQSITLSNKNSFKISNANSLLDSIKILESTGKALLIAQPSIKIINKFRSTIKIGDKIPYITTSHSATNSYQQINSFKTGITLSVLPTVTNSKIKCDINLNLKHIKYWKSINQQELPVIAERDLETSSYFFEKKTSLIGNYINVYHSKNTNQSPLIKDIPILNKLLKYKKNQKNKTLLLIFMTLYN